MWQEPQLTQTLRNMVSGIFRILERGQALAPNGMGVEGGSPYCWQWGLWRKIFWIKMVWNWNTVLKLMCPQQKALQQMSMHCACRFFIKKLGCAMQRGPSPNGPLNMPGTAGPIGTKFCVRLSCGRGSVLLWRRCATLCTSGFMDDVRFGRNERDAEGWWLIRVAMVV